MHSTQNWLLSLGKDSSTTHQLNIDSCSGGFFAIFDVHCDIETKFLKLLSKVSFLEIMMLMMAVAPEVL